MKGYDKFNLYQEAGVLEYWIIDPEHNLAFTYCADKKTGKFEMTNHILTDEDALKSSVFPEFELPLIEVFGD